jgi:uncharacterized protein
MQLSSLSAAEVIERLDLAPHPEGGHFVETFRDGPGADGRARASVIYFLLQAGEISHWHRIDAIETWAWHAGAPLVLQISEDGVSTRAERLGDHLLAGHKLHAVVPAHAWQSAESVGAWTLVSCFVAPGFEFSGFELAPRDWRPHHK